MHVDEAGDDGLAGHVDDLRIGRDGRRRSRPDGHDAVAIDHDRAIGDDLVLEETVVDQREAGGAVGRVDEPARRKCRQADLVRAAFGGESTMHHGERALGVRAVDPGRKREVGAQPVVASWIVDLVRDAQELFLRS